MENQLTAAAVPDLTDPRRYPRFTVPLPVSILVSEEGSVPAETATLQDISLTGLYFVSERAYDTDRHLSVQIALGGRDYHIRVLVQRSQRKQEGNPALYGIAVLYVRGNEIHPFLADLAAFLNHQPNAIFAAVADL